MRYAIRNFGLLLVLTLFSLLNYQELFAADAVVSWDPNTESNLAGYKIYVGTASQTYNAPIDVGNVTAWTVSGLSVGATYYFAVTAYNTAGTESGFSNEASKTFVTTSDTTPPAISSVNAIAITLNEATITWATDEPADSQVQYGATTAYGSATGLNPAMATAHSQGLTGLQPGTVYHYRVLSRDAAGNLATSSDVTFTTASDTAPPSVPTDLTVAVISTSQINLSWSAPADNVGVAGYRIYRDGNQIGTSVEPSYSDTGLSPSTTYRYTVSAIDAAGNASAQSSAASATTLAASTATTVTLNPLHDTYLNLDRVINDAEPTLNTYTWPDRMIANTILMKFDLSTLPAGAVVQGATLNLAQVDSDTLPASTYTVTVHKLINKDPDLTKANGYTYNGVDPWSASTCCYDQIPLAQGDISAPYDTQAVDKTAGFKSWSVTSMIQEWLAAPSSNYGLMINADPSQPADAYRTFASMEALDAALHPSLTITYTIPNGPGATQSDTEPPTAAMNAPANGAFLRGTVPVQGTVSDNIEVVKVEYLLDGAVQATQQGVNLGGVSWFWDTTLTPDGPHQLLIRAYDAAGLAGSAQTTSVIVDNTPPSTPGAPAATSVQQNQLSLSWPAATDAISLAGYRISRNGTIVATTANSSYTDTGLAPNTGYTYTVTAVDTAGNSSPASPPLTVTTPSSAPLFSGITASNITSNSAVISWETNVPATAQVDFGRIPYRRTTPLDTTLQTSHSVTLTGLLSNTLYHYRVKSRDAQGNLSVSKDRTFRTK